MRIISLLLVGLLFSAPVWAFEPFVVSDIHIEGLNHLSEGTVLNYLPVKVGDTVNEFQTPAIVKALFKTGFFENIQLSREGDTLVVVVQERPTISHITLVGNRDIKTEELMKNLRSVGLAEGRIFDKVMLSEVQQELQRQYFSRGKYAVTVDIETKTESRNRVALTLRIHEGKPAKIREINIVGAHAFSEKFLRQQMQLSSTHWLSWVTKDDQYAKQKLSGDRETLRSYYLDRGYLNFQLDSTQVAMTPNKQDIYITLNILEGDVYTLKDIQFKGELLLPEKELRALLSIHSGEIFSRSKVTDSIATITDRLGEMGYAFSNVLVDPQIQSDSHAVSLTFTLEPGHRYYVRQVRFVGNAKTEDRVLRREVSQFEGAVISSKQVKESQTRLNRTGYFSEVQVDVHPVSGIADQVDVIYTVKEASSGQLSGSVGYSDLDGLLFQFSVSNRNFVGTGNNVDFVFNRSHSSTTYSVGYLNPYYTTHGVSRGFHLFFNETDLSNTTQIANYATNNLGGNLEYGIPLGSLTRLNVGLGYNHTLLAVNTQTAPGEIIGFVDEHGKRYQEIDASLGWVYNSLDRYVFPESGFRLSTGGMASIPSADLQYYRLNAETQLFRPLFYDFLFFSQVSVGYGNGYGKTNALPFFKNFFSGGARSIRGYGESSLGPRDAFGAPLGGNFKIEGSTGIVLPNFISPETKSVRTQVFLDVGQVFDTRDHKRVANGTIVPVVNPAGLRLSSGVSVTWMSPLAPLVFSYAIPLNDKPGDNTQRFSFTFGTFF
jgi:outer membrane protein insertion porin family